MIELEKAHAQLEELKLGVAAAILDSRLQVTTEKNLTYLLCRLCRKRAVSSP